MTAAATPPKGKPGRKPRDPSAPAKVVTPCEMVTRAARILDQALPTIEPMRHQPGGMELWSQALDTWRAVRQLSTSLRAAELSGPADPAQSAIV